MIDLVYANGEHRHNDRMLHRKKATGHASGTRSTDAGRVRSITGAHRRRPTHVRLVAAIIAVPPPRRWFPRGRRDLTPPVQREGRGGSLGRLTSAGDPRSR